MSGLESIKILRERTGVGIVECKKILQETNGDVEKAVELLRKAGQAKAVKKSGRITAEGLIGLKEGNDTVAIVEVNCETDFVARDENFIQFVNNTLDCIIRYNMDDVDNLKKQDVDGVSLEKTRENLVSKIGENINIRRCKLMTNKDNSIVTYLHGGRIGVVVLYKGSDQSIAKDIAMHIAANNPIVIEPKDVPQSLIDSEKEIFMVRAKEEGTPADKINIRIENQVKKFILQNALLGQPFVKDPSQTVEKILKTNSTEVLEFIRFEVGEGIEKKEENFAEEVMAQIK
ncbi:MAG: elongation factor Ts [Legionellales bacterium]|nr:elongation factor Ts [Legionellales bacterium]